MTKKITAILSAVLVLLSMTGITAGVFAADAAQTSYIDNSDVIPKYVDDSQVVLEDSGGGLMSPDWLKTMMIVEINPMFASPDGTLEGLSAVLDHYREMGINGLWLCPIYETTDGLGHYANYGPHTISHLLTGTTDYAEGWKRFKAFVDEAHSKNIRIFLDTVTWGVATDAPLYNEHPSWIAGVSGWGGWAYDWNNAEFREWYIKENVRLVTEIGVDGFRCDCEPSVTGYEMWGEVRDRCVAAGQKIAIFTEMTNERLAPSYDFDEHTSDDETQWTNWEMFTEIYNVVDSVKQGLGLGTKYMQQTGEGGTARFYSYRLTCHDSTDYHANGSLISLGYQAILTPFIPIWFMGEEFDNPLVNGGQGGIIYRNPLDLTALNNKENRDFYEKVKALIRVRRQYPEIFNEFPANHMESNICKVETYGLETLGAYARYAGGKGVIVLGNNNVHDKTNPITVVIPYKEMGIGNNTAYRVTNLLTGKVLAEGNRKTLADFTANVAYDEVGAYLVEAIGTPLKEEEPKVVSDPSEPVEDPDEPEEPEWNEEEPEDNDPDDSEPEEQDESEPEDDSSDTSDDEKKPSKGRKSKKVKVTVTENIPVWQYVLPIGGGVLVIAAVVVFLILRKKRKNG